jgi:hypothetical protein
MHRVLNCHNIANWDTYGSMCLPLVMQCVSKKEFYNDIPNDTAWRVLRKRCVERWIFYTPLSVKVFVTLGTQ